MSVSEPSMKTPIQTTKSGSSSRENFAIGAQSRVTALLVCLLLHSGAQAQTDTDNFNTGVDAGWTHYAPLQTAPWNEQVSWTFPADPAGGFFYRIFGGVPNINYDPAANNNTGPARVGSFRSTSYSDFSAAVDLVTWNDAIPENTAFIAFHVTTPGFLTTFGFFAGYSQGAWNDQ